MSAVRIRLLLPLALSLGIHAGLLALWAVQIPAHPLHALEVSEPLQARLVTAPVQEMKEAYTMHGATEALRQAVEPRFQPAIAMPSRMAVRENVPVADSMPVSPVPEKTLATMPAPPPPTPEQWKLASTYTLKNSKRYRYNWGQLVRSMMGTAVEGLQHGLVRFRIEIAPDGTLAKVDVLWSTSDIAEKLAWQAIRSLPPLPPTPTGKPLVFDQTIAFVPFETGWPPIYKNDCLPDPPSFHNPFAWNGSSPQNTSPKHPENSSVSRNAPPQAECPPDSEPDSFEAEEKDMERQFKEWGSARLNRAD